jgi:hypothetical protein
MSLKGACRAQEPTLPTDNEIQLVLTQADRAMQQYKLLIDQEERQLGQSDEGKGAVSKDHRHSRTHQRAFCRETQGSRVPAVYLAYFAI